MHFVNCWKCTTILFIRLFSNWINGSAKRIKKRNPVCLHTYCLVILGSIFHFESIVRWNEECAVAFSHKFCDSGYGHCYIGPSREREWTYGMNKWNRMWNDFAFNLAYTIGWIGIVRIVFAYCFRIHKSQHAYHYLFIYVFIHSFLLTFIAFILHGNKESFAFNIAKCHFHCQCHESNGSTTNPITLPPNCSLFFSTFIIIGFSFLCLFFFFITFINK